MGGNRAVFTASNVKIVRGFRFVAYLPFTGRVLYLSIIHIAALLYGKLLGKVRVRIWNNRWFWIRFLFFSAFVGFIYIYKTHLCATVSPSNCQFEIYHISIGDIFHKLWNTPFYIHAGNCEILHMNWFKSRLKSHMNQKRGRI